MYRVGQISKTWKLITFIIAFISFNLIGPFSGDPTWDLYTSSAMSLLTYLSAPWSVGIFYKFLKKTFLSIVILGLPLVIVQCSDL